MSKISEVREILIAYAKKRQTIVGSDLAKLASLNSSKEVNATLDEISESCLENEVPNLTALVIQAKTGLPSKRFFDLYTFAGEHSNTTREKRKLWKEMVEKVYEYTY